MLIRNIVLMAAAVMMFAHLGLAEPVHVSVSFKLRRGHAGMEARGREGSFDLRISVEYDHSARDDTGGV